MACGLGFSTLHGILQLLHFLVKKDNFNICLVLTVHSYVVVKRHLRIYYQYQFSYEMEFVKFHNDGVPFLICK